MPGVTIRPTPALVPGTAQRELGRVQGAGCWQAHGCEVKPRLQEPAGRTPCHQHEPQTAKLLHSSCPIHLQHGHSLKDCFLVSCKRESMQITTTSSRWFFQRGFLQLRLPVKAPQPRHGRAQRDSACRCDLAESSCCSCSHVTGTCMSLTQYVRCVSKQSGSSCHGC